MFVPVACIKCGKPFQVPDAVAGTTVACPWCKENVLALPLAGLPGVDTTTDRPAIKTTTEPVGPPSAAAPLSLDDDPPTARPIRRPRPVSGKPRRFPFLTAAIVLLLSVFAFSCTLFTRGYHAGRVSDSSWGAFTPPDGSCTVDMIGDTRSEKLPALPLPISLTGEEFIAKGWYSGVSTWVGWYDLDPGWAKSVADDKDGSQIDPVLNSGQKKRVEVLKGTLQKEGKVLFNAYRGRELQVETERGIAVERLFVVTTGSHPRLYFVGMEGKNLNPTGPAATRLFTSFRINQ
jgi:hypothetical protein